MQQQAISCSIGIATSRTPLPYPVQVTASLAEDAACALGVPLLDVYDYLKAPASWLLRTPPRPVVVSVKQVGFWALVRFEIPAWSELRLGGCGEDCGDCGSIHGSNSLSNGFDILTHAEGMECGVPRMHVGSCATARAVAEDAKENETVRAAARHAQGLIPNEAAKPGEPRLVSVLLPIRSTHNVESTRAPASTSLSRDLPIRHILLMPPQPEMPISKDDLRGLPLSEGVLPDLGDGGAEAKATVRGGAEAEATASDQLAWELTPGSTVSFRVAACNEMGRGPFSTAANLTLRMPREGDFDCGKELLEAASVESFEERLAEIDALSAKEQHHKKIQNDEILNRRYRSALRELIMDRWEVGKCTDTSLRLQFKQLVASRHATEVAKREKAAERSAAAGSGLMALCGLGSSKEPKKPPTWSFKPLVQGNQTECFVARATPQLEDPWVVGHVVPATPSTSNGESPLIAGGGGTHWWCTRFAEKLVKQLRYVLNPDPTRSGPDAPSWKRRSLGATVGVGAFFYFTYWVAQLYTPALTELLPERTEPPSPSPSAEPSSAPSPVPSPFPTLPPTATQVPTSIPAGLLAQYSFNAVGASSGSVDDRWMQDESGMGNDCVAVGGVRPGPDRWGRPDESAYFDGSGHLSCALKGRAFGRATNASVFNDSRTICMCGPLSYVSVHGGRDAQRTAARPRSPDPSLSSAQVGGA